MSDEAFIFNGINGETGAYALPPISADALKEIIIKQKPPPHYAELLQRKHAVENEHFGLEGTEDPKKLDEAGWGIVFAYDADPAVEEALSELLVLRRSQAGDLFKIYRAEDGVRAGERKSKWLARRGKGPGPVDPTMVPYYLLLVGSPAAISYSFQAQLSVQYAVGRIHFNTLGEYASYARSVVTAEKEGITLPRHAAFAGVVHAGDRATQIGVEDLVVPLSDYFREEAPAGWRTEVLAPAGATKAKLSSLIGGAETPALLFTTSHGLELSHRNPRQCALQGALICEDWPGPKRWERGNPIPQDYFFAGEDIAPDGNLLGLIAFTFACFGGGTPRHERFARNFFAKEQKQIAPYPFVADLPRRMLAHPRGGALAVVGHVDRAFGYSFKWKGVGRQIGTYRSYVKRLLEGYPIGYAIDEFNGRYAEIAADLKELIDDYDFGAEVDAEELASLWTAQNDARGVGIMGDPAVRIPRLAVAEPMARPMIALVTSTGTPKTDVQPCPST